LIFESSWKSLFPKSSKKPSASLQPLLLVSKICSAEQLSSSSSSAGRIIKGPQTQSSLSLYRYDRHDHIDIDSNLSVCGPFIMVEVMIFCIRKGVNGVIPVPKWTTNIITSTYDNNCKFYYIITHAQQNGQ
jgi:hypothetical protein